MLALNDSPFVNRAVSPANEMGAYEYLWSQKGATYKRLADRFKQNPGCIPSDFVGDNEITETLEKLQVIFDKFELGRFGVRVRGANEYPLRLQDAYNPLEVLYYQGYWNLIDSPSVAIVGARKATKDGKRRARKLAHHFVKDGYTIMSGLASGIDQAAHRAAIEFKGRTIAVIGTPLTHYYPKEHKDLQDKIRDEHLLISQVPFLRYLDQDFRSNRAFFPERNVTMSALSKATIIVEASDTSGTLYQARAALAQGRKLFILDSCFENRALSWPEKYLRKGAIRVKDYGDVIKHLE